MLAEAQPRCPDKGSGDTEAWRRFDLEQRLQGSLSLEQTPRARMIREINRIALRYGWTQPIVEALDRARAQALCLLQDEDLEQLVMRMRRYVDSAMHGCDPEDGPPAR